MDKSLSDNPGKSAKQQYECPHYRVDEIVMRSKLIVKDMTQPGLLEVRTRWCEHPKTPISYAAATSFGGIDRLACGGCFAACPIGMKSSGGDAS